MSEFQVKQLEESFKLMERKQFKSAAKLYDSLSLSLKDSSAQILSLYNAGLAYKSAGECQKALFRFRSVLNKSFKRFKEFQARTLLEISFVYECLGEFTLSLSSLKDLERNLQFLPFETKHILYPARLSLAWAKQGKLNLAETYKSLSLNRILEYKKVLKSEDKIKQDISRLFYLMGKSYVKQEHISPKVFIVSFYYHQLYLLQSLFVKDKTWSDQAKKELDKLFHQLIFVLSQIENKKQYKKSIDNSLKIGMSLVTQEKSKEFEDFYNKKSQKIVKLLSQNDKNIKK
ncbi:MAG: hypothetical protein GDA46_01820 [Bdellovibrionales bacterium]|nr:hypothetical protein [Bdellovibrionales bacterium]